MSAKPQIEETEIGAQTLIDGVRPVTLGECVACLLWKITARTTHPMTPKRNPFAVQKPCDLYLLDEVGLFDEVGLAQIDLLDFIANSNGD